MMSHISAKTFVTQTIIGPYVLGEVPAPLQITIQDSAGTVIDLTGYTPSFVIVRLDGETPVAVGAGSPTIPDAANGLTQYEWVSTDFDAEGMYRGVMWVGNGTLRYASTFFEWFIRDSLTTVPAV